MRHYGSLVGKEKGIFAGMRIHNLKKIRHMTLVKFNQRPAEKRINNLFEDFFSHLPSRFFQDDFTHGNHIPVNIRETEKAYLVDVVAPGMEKSDFKVNIDNNLLTISGEKKAEPGSGQERLVRKEYTVRNFARTFTLDETINTEQVLAKYEQGVLTVELPKKVEAKVQPKEISIQ
jgi:HSP20 family protein